MHRLFPAAGIGLLVLSLSLTATATECGCCGRAGCTDQSPCEPDVSTCKSTWDKKETRQATYTMKCEPMCERAAECFCTGPVECRCDPPGGSVFTKKKMYKQDAEKVEKVQKYAVQMVPATPCDCSRCAGVCWWNPFSVLGYLISH